MRRRSLALLPALASVLVATTARAAPSNDDPNERMNRVSFAIYESLDRRLIRPAALAYQRAVPEPVQRGIEHVLTNLHEPVVAANDLLQGRLRKARAALVRFAINSTGGVAGVFDVAAKLGVPYHDNGFALTLGRAGVRPGPYLFIPVAGPSTVRDAIGNGIDDLVDPFQWLVGARLATVLITRSVVSGLDQRASADAGLEALLADATDPYATLRSVYLQNQQAKIDDLPPTAAPVLPTFDDDGAPAVQPSSAPEPTANLWVDGQLADLQLDTGGFSAIDTEVTVDPTFAPGSVGAAVLPALPLRTNRAVDDGRYDDIQNQVVTVGPTGQPEAIVVNRDPLTGTQNRATLKGGEFEATLVPFKELRVSGFYGYATGTYDRFIDSTTGVPISLAGQAISGIAQTTGGVTIDYQPVLADRLGSPEFVANIYGRSKLSEKSEQFAEPATFGVELRYRFGAS